MEGDFLFTFCQQDARASSANRCTTDGVSRLSNGTPHRVVSVAGGEDSAVVIRPRRPDHLQLAQRPCITMPPPQLPSSVIAATTPVSPPDDGDDPNTPSSLFCAKGTISNQRHSTCTLQQGLSLQRTPGLHLPPRESNPVDEDGAEEEEEVATTTSEGATSDECLLDVGEGEGEGGGVEEETPVGPRCVVDLRHTISGGSGEDVRRRPSLAQVLDRKQRCESFTTTEVIISNASLPRSYSCPRLATFLHALSLEHKTYR